MVNLVRAAALSKYAEVARQYGLNPVSLLRKHSMSLRLIADPERRIPILPVLALLEESAQLADCPGMAKFSVTSARTRTNSQPAAKAAVTVAYKPPPTPTPPTVAM